jgi:hypothetical protein
MGLRLTVHRRASRLHRWLAMLVFVQALLWFSSGVIMSFMPIEQVRGEHLVAKLGPAAIDPTLAARLPALLGEGPVTGIALRPVLGRTLAVIEDGQGEPHLVDPATGDPIAFNAALATRIATAAWKGDAVATQVRQVNAESTEYRGPLPAWRVDFADDEATHVYVDPATARIAAVRTRGWRFYDFMWGLHIMDWKNHENFNSPWLLAFACMGLALALAGTVLLWMRWPRRRRRQATERAT